MTAIARRPNDRLEHDLLASWLEVAKVGLCVLDPSGQVVMLNSAAGKKLHVDPVLMFNANVSNLFERVDATLGFLQWVASPTDEGEMEILGLPGSPQRLLIKASAVRRSDSFYKVISITDITEIWKAKQAAELLVRQWGALDAALTISDARLPDTPITYVSPKFEAMTGYSAAEAVGRNCRFLQGTDTGQRGISEMRDAIRQEKPVQVVVRNYRKSGVMYWAEISISPVHDEAGALTHFVAIQHVRLGPGKAEI